MVAADSFQLAAEKVLHSTRLTGQETWVFGFGSLIYKPGFEFAGVEDGYIKGYKRVFYQGSTDHRGTPEFPGRTVTLECDDSAVTWGRAFRLAGDEKQQLKTLKYLEWREKQYDIRAEVGVYRKDDVIPVVKALVYIASPDRSRNPNYLGPAPLEDIAKQVATAVGPSGPNVVYVYKLANAMREMGVDDEELFKLEALVRQYHGLNHNGMSSLPSTPLQPCEETHGMKTVQACEDLRPAHIVPL